MIEIEALKRILVVDNDDDVIRSVPFNLRMAGYTVLTATTIAEALDKIASEIFHLAIVDIRLIDEREEDDQSGFNVAKHLPPYVPCVIYTAYESNKNLKEAWTKIGAKASIDKRDPRAAEQLIDTVDHLFTTEVKLNFELDIPDSFDLAELAAHIQVPADANRLVPSAEDVRRILQTLFYSASTVQVEYLLPPEAAPTRSQSGAVLVSARPRLQGVWAEPVVIKFGACEDIADEVAGYTQIEPFLGGQRRADMRGNAYSRRIGGLVYSFIDADDAGDIRVFDDLYMKEPAERIGSLLNKFFRHTFSRLYDDAARELLDLSVTYPQAIGLTPQKLRDAVRQRRPDALNEPQLRFKGLRGAFLNPILWLLHADTFRHLPVIGRVCLCHGDLHGRNMLVDQADHFWLIDFARVGRSHALRDFAELETDIKFNLLPVVDLQELLAFEHALLTPTTSALPHTTFATDNDRLAHAHTVVTSLRRTAAELRALDGDMHEYYGALLFHTLNVLRLEHISAEKKEYALLAASLICQRLDSWEGGLPWPASPPAAHADPPLLPAPAEAALIDANHAILWPRILGASFFLLLGVGAIALLWGAMRWFAPSWQDQLGTLLLLSVLIIAVFGLLGLASGAAVVDALQSIIRQLFSGGGPKSGHDRSDAEEPMSGRDRNDEG
jgi:CheY-like chemotaxis protein